MDSLSCGNSVRSFRAIDHKQSVRFFIDEHLFKLGQFKFGIATVSKRNEGLRRFFNDDVHHSGFVVAHNDGPNKDGKAVFPGSFESREG